MIHLTEQYIFSLPQSICLNKNSRLFIFIKMPTRIGKQIQVWGLQILYALTLLQDVRKKSQRSRKCPQGNLLEQVRGGVGVIFKQAYQIYQILDILSLQYRKDHLTEYLLLFINPLPKQGESDLLVCDDKTAPTVMVAKGGVI